MTEKIMSCYLLLLLFSYFIGCQGCGGTIEKSGSISSPNYPSSYTDSLDCTWTIKADVGASIQLSFDDFLTETCCDHITVYDTSVSNMKLAKISGSQEGITNPIRSLSNTMRVEFKTDGSVTRRGFKATVKSVCGAAIASEKGVIMSPNYPEFYPNSTECSWLISVRHNQRITINIIQLDTESGYDTLRLYDGQTENHERLYIGSGRNQNVSESFRSTFNQMLVLMKTDGTVSGKGFKLQYIAETVEDSMNTTRNATREKLSFKSLEKAARVLSMGGMLPLSKGALSGAWPVSVVEPNLIVFARHNRNIGSSLPYALSAAAMPAEFKRQQFLTKDKIIFIVHGFHDNQNSPWLCNMKDALLNAEDQVVVLVNWKGKLDVGWWQYSKAAASTQTVGTWLAEHVKTLKAERPSMSVWGIGHGLGAHLLGKAGRESAVFDRISALDPSGPSWEEHNEERRLQHTDANMVDVIHTDGYPAWSSKGFKANYHGTLIPLGSLDFYPNFGFDQPDCGQYDVGCSHLRAVDLYICSISDPALYNTSQVLKTPPSFNRKVTDTRMLPYSARMGYYADQNHQVGMFYLPTNGICRDIWTICDD